MSDIEPHALADMWYLKFGHEWVVRDDLDKDWKSISRKLMQSNLAYYELIYSVGTVGTREIIKLKESCR